MARFLVQSCTTHKLVLLCIDIIAPAKRAAKSKWAMKFAKRQVFEEFYDEELRQVQRNHQNSKRFFDCSKPTFCNLYEAKYVK